LPNREAGKERSFWRPHAQDAEQRETNRKRDQDSVLHESEKQQNARINPRRAHAFNLYQKKRHKKNTIEASG